MVTSTFVRSAPSGSKRTSPLLGFPSIARQAITWSGSCRVISAIPPSRLPPISATQRRRVSSIWATDSTFSMNFGNSSNCVHWLYAVDTGTLTSIASLTSATDDPFPLGFRSPTQIQVALTGWGYVYCNAPCDARRARRCGCPRDACRLLDLAAIRARGYARGARRAGAVRQHARGAPPPGRQGHAGLGWAVRRCARPATEGRHESFRPRLRVG